MLYIICACYHVKLILSGISKINSAIAVSRLIPESGITDEDIIINIGICGSTKEKPGSCLMVNKIYDAETFETFYPDILFKHKLEEGILITGSQPRYIDDSDKIRMSAEHFKRLGRRDTYNPVFGYEYRIEAGTAKYADEECLIEFVSREASKYSDKIMVYR